MRKIEILELSPEATSVKAIRPGDFIQVPHGRSTVYRQVFGTPSLQGGNATLKILRFCDFKPAGHRQFWADAHVNIVPKEAVEHALEQKILDVLRPGVAGKSSDRIFQILRARFQDSPGHKRIATICQKMVDEGRLVEKSLPYRSNHYVSHYRQFLKGCSLPTLVYHAQRHEVGWLIGFEDRHPQPNPYPVVKWFDGRVELSHEKFVEPVDDDRTIRGVLQAIAYRHGQVEDGFLEIPPEIVRALCAGRIGAHGQVLSAVSRILNEQGFCFPDHLPAKEVTLRYLDQHYSGWRQGVVPQELMTDAPPGFLTVLEH